MLPATESVWNMKNQWGILTRLNETDSWKTMNFCTFLFDRKLDFVSIDYYQLSVSIFISSNIIIIS